LATHNGIYILSTFIYTILSKEETVRLIRLILTVITCVIQSGSFSGPVAPKYRDVEGMSYELPPLVVAAVDALNDFGRYLMPDSTKQLLPYAKVSVIVDFPEFRESLRRPGAKMLAGLMDREEKEAIAFTFRGLEDVFVNWQNDRVVYLDWHYRHGEKQPIYVLAAYLGHEIGHIAEPCDLYAAHIVQRDVIEYFQKRGLLRGYEMFVTDARARANMPHPNFRPCR